LKTYVVLRRNAWRTAEDLEAAAERTAQVGEEEMSDDSRLIRSYVLAEENGSVGAVWIYEGASPDEVREHAERAGLRADEVIEVADAVIVRPDPGQLES
jgi:hypothetical protein